MSLIKKIFGMLGAVSPIERAIGSCIGHFLEGNTPAAVSDLLLLIDAESNSHPGVRAELLKIQSALVAAGLAVVSPAPAAPVVSPPVQQVAEPVAVQAPPLAAVAPVPPA